MTANEAKQILLAYRPWTDDARDPDVAEALALSRRDADLAHWLEGHCSLQNALHERFQAVTVPDGLQQQILSEYKARELTVGWSRRATIAVAASLLLLVAVGSLWWNLPRQPQPDTSFDAYRTRMVRAAVRAYGMDLETNDVARIRVFLDGQQSHGDYVLPKNLEQAETVGCGALSWQGKPVAMVCFRTGKPLPPGAKSDLFLFVINEEDLAATPPGQGPQFANVSTLVTASWRAGGKVYVLAGSDEAEVRQRL